MCALCVVLALRACGCACESARSREANVFSRHRACPGLRLREILVLVVFPDGYSWVSAVLLSLHRLITLRLAHSLLPPIRLQENVFTRPHDPAAAAAGGFKVSYVGARAVQEAFACLNFSPSM